MLASLLLFAITEAFFSASPGPAVFMVISAMVVGGWRTAHCVVFGVLLGNLIYFIISCVLLLTATRYNQQFFVIIKLMGAAYLMYLRMDRYARARPTQPETEYATENATDAPPPDTHRRQQKFFLGALAMQLANPKTIVFFSVFLPQFIHADYNIPMQFAIMAGLSWSIEYTILFVYLNGTKLLMHRAGNWHNRLEHLGNFAMLAAVAWSLFTIFG